MNEHDQPAGEAENVPPTQPVGSTGSEQGVPPQGKPPQGTSEPLQVGSICTDKEAVQMGMFCHLSGLVAGSMFMMGFIGPLILWLIKKDDHPYIDDQGKEALNFQLNVLGINLICSALITISCGMLIPIIALPWIWNLVFGIMATINSSKGIVYRYPANLRIIP